MISVICAYNNTETLHGMLVPSLEKQTCRDYELIAVNAREHGFTGAAQTLNYGASVAKGEILVFVHQDIELLSEDFLKDLNDYCRAYDFGVAGVAGGIAKERRVYSSVTMDSDHRLAGERATAPMEVDTLDECLFFVKRDRFKGFTDYGAWHFYAVEYALRCKLDGEKIMLFPLEVYHLSPGWSLDKSYWLTLKKVAKQFRGRLRIIPTTMGNYRNNAFLPIEIRLRRLRRKLFK